LELKLAIFDLDGTLVDSRAVISWAMDQAFKALDLSPPGYERTRQIVGLSLDEACALLAGGDLAPQRLPQLVEAYKEAFIENRRTRAIAEPLYAGAEETVLRLSDEGWLLSIATGKARRGVDAFFEHHPTLKAAFISAHCADDGPGKPNPAMVQAALDFAGVPASRSLMIGDSTHDINMAHAAGVHAVGVSWGFHEPEELRAARAAHVAEDFPCLYRHVCRHAEGLAA
jgi:phosphoglycolate phosphatase